MKSATETLNEIAPAWYDEDNYAWVSQDNAVKAMAIHADEKLSNVKALIESYKERQQRIEDLIKKGNLSVTISAELRQQSAYFRSTISELEIAIN